MFYCLSKYFNSSLAYEVVERALRTGDIVFYNYQGSEKNIQKSVAPIERKLARASRLSHLCSLLPWLACMIDDSESRESGGSSNNNNTNDVFKSDANEMIDAETEMMHTWSAWQHATLIVVMHDETQESNPTRNARKTLPYVFVPNSKNRLTLMPLRTLLAQSKTQLFAVRHLLINDNEAMPVNVDAAASSNNGDDDTTHRQQSALPKLSSAAKTLKMLSSSTRSCIHGSIVDFYTALFNARENNDLSSFTHAQILSLLLREPAGLKMDKHGMPTTTSATITASQEYLINTFTLTARANALATNNIHLPNDELIPLFLASPAFLALHALYVARVSRLLPRAFHNAAHLRDTGIVDRFLMPGYSYSDEVVMHYDLPVPVMPTALRETTSKSSSTTFAAAAPVIPMLLPMQHQQQQQQQ